jgi:hypothetical protein
MEEMEEMVEEAAGKEGWEGLEGKEEVRVAEGRERLSSTAPISHSHHSSSTWQLPGLSHLAMHHQQLTDPEEPGRGAGLRNILPLKRRQ